MENKTKSHYRLCWKLFSRSNKLKQLFSECFVHIFRKYLWILLWRIKRAGAFLRATPIQEIKFSSLVFCSNKNMSGAHIRKRKWKWKGFQQFFIILLLVNSCYIFAYNLRLWLINCVIEPYGHLLVSGLKPFQSNK